MIFARDFSPLSRNALFEDFSTPSGGQVWGEHKRIVSAEDELGTGRHLKSCYVTLFRRRDLLLLLLFS